MSETERTTTDAQAAALEAKARNCRDNAAAEMLVADAFRAEYMAGLSGAPTANAETHARSLELYDFVIRGQHRAKNYAADALLFGTAAIALRANPAGIPVQEG